MTWRTKRGEWTTECVGARRIQGGTITLSFMHIIMQNALHAVGVVQLVYCVLALSGPAPARHDPWDTTGVHARAAAWCHVWRL